MKRKLIVVGVFALSGLLLSGLLLRHLILRPEQQARQMVSAIQTIDPDARVSDEVARILRLCGGRCKATNNECKGGACRIDFFVDNALLTHLHLAPWTVLVARIEVLHDAFSYVLVDYSLSKEGEKSSGIWVSYFPSEPGSAMTLLEGPIGKGDNLTVQLQGAATLDQKRGAYHFDFGCLGRLRGCAGVSELAPSMWPRRKDPALSLNN
jgi:hypothetical protein